MKFIIPVLLSLGLCSGCVRRLGLLLVNTQATSSARVRYHLVSRWRVAGSEVNGGSLVADCGDGFMFPQGTQAPAK